MGFLWFGRKKEAENDRLKEEVRGSFTAVKQDVKKIGQWIKHLNAKDDELEQQIIGFRQDIDDIKQFISFFDNKFASRVFKSKQSAVGKQPSVYGVQTPVQTVVQTAIFEGLTGNETMIMWTLLNTDLKLSYEDIAVLLGKDKSTVRGQINNIKQKNENLITEFSEKNGKKRYYVDNKMKDLLLKKMKVNRERNFALKSGKQGLK